jgi:protease I
MTPTVGAPERAAVLVTDGYLDLEFWYPVLRLREGGVDVAILGPEADSTFHSTLGYPVVPDKSMSEAAEHWDLVVIPGGGAAERLAGDEVALSLLSRLARDGARVVTIGKGALVAAAANAPVEAQCEDADGLPQLFRTLLGAD